MAAHFVRTADGAACDALSEIARARQALDAWEAQLSRLADCPEPGVALAARRAGRIATASVSAAADHTAAAAALAADSGDLVAVS